jgi:hypothetical protein
MDPLYVLTHDLSFSTTVTFLTMRTRSNHCKSPRTTSSLEAGLLIADPCARHMNATRSLCLRVFILPILGSERSVEMAVRVLCHLLSSLEEYEFNASTDEAQFCNPSRLLGGRARILGSRAQLEWLRTPVILVALLCVDINNHLFRHNLKLRTMSPLGPRQPFIKLTMDTGSGHSACN